MVEVHLHVGLGVLGRGETLGLTAATAGGHRGEERRKERERGEEVGESGSVSRGFSFSDQSR